MGGDNSEESDVERHRSYYNDALEQHRELQQELPEDSEEWDRRIGATGCYVENMALQLCHADTGDWRQCLGEMQRFKECWSRQGNDKRVHTVDRE